MLEKKIEQIRIEIDNAIDEIKNSVNMKKIVDEAAVIVRRRSLLGFSVPSDGARRERLKPLSQSYKDQRRGLVVFFRDKKGRIRSVPTSPGFQSRLKLSPKTTAGKSNLTLGGELLDSLQGQVTGRGRGNVRPTGTRKDGLTNQEVARFVDEGGRPFLHLSDNEIRQLQILAEGIFNDILIRKLNKIK